MPTADSMGWSKTQRRWFKRYRGKLYFVSPKQLHCEPTKEASRVAANDWWDKKQTEIDEALGKAKQLPAHVTDHYQEAKENWRLYGKWHRRYGGQDEAQKSDTMIEWLDQGLASDNPPFPLNKSQFDPREKFLRNIQDEDDRTSLQLVWMDRFNTILKEERNEKAVPLENTIRCHIDDYLALRKATFQASGKIGTFHSLKQWTEVFKSFVEPTAHIETVNEALWEKFFIFLSGKVASGDYSPTTAKNYFQAARSFITNRWERKFVDLPRNLRSEQLVFKAKHKEPVVFTLEEISTYLKAATNRQKLYLLLALNCGMYPNDISSLLHTEVDWIGGRIIRKRTKTRDKSEKVPKVDYPLWKETFRLLKECRSDHSTLVLVNESGLPLVEESDKEGKWKRRNNIKSEFFRLQHRTMKLSAKERKPLKSLRKTGATMLEQSVYGRFAEHYLGEAPSTIASKHYVHKNGPEFDEAIKWLGQALGLG